MQYIKVNYVPFSILQKGNTHEQIYPCLRDNDGDQNALFLTPHHCRSLIIGETENGRYIVSKGNGLSYTQFRFLNTCEFGDDTFGLLLRKDAERDFIMGQEIETLGIKTNHMEYVLELKRSILLQNGHTIKPILLQYDVECPYRICDAPFMTQKQIRNEVAKWEQMNDKGVDQAYLIAANVLIRNLRILHDHHILHNAIHEQNYTWALELLDFELACSPDHPYEREDDQRHVKDLFPREILHTYFIINYIAGVLGEDIDFATVDNLFAYYGFNIQQYAV